MLYIDLSTGPEPELGALVLEGEDSLGSGLLVLLLVGGLEGAGLLSLEVSSSFFLVSLLLVAEVAGLAWALLSLAPLAGAADLLGSYFFAGAEAAGAELLAGA